MSGNPKFTLHHGFAASLALHSALGLPFVLHAFASPPPEPSTLVVELQGLVADSQTEQKVAQDTKGQARSERAAEASAAPAAAAVEDQRQDVAENGAEAPPPTAAPVPPAAEVQSGSAGASDSSGAEERQNAQTIKADREAEINLRKTYVKRLAKKVQANLVYPNEGRQAGLQGVATVSFTVLRSGQIQPESLKIIASSGQPKLDASALKTVRASVPFEPPPSEMTVAIAVVSGRSP